ASDVPGWFRPTALLRPNVLPVNVMAPFVIVVKRLTYCACAVVAASTVATISAVSHHRAARAAAHCPLPQPVISVPGRVESSYRLLPWVEKYSIGRSRVDIGARVRARFVRT